MKNATRRISAGKNLARHVHHLMIMKLTGSSLIILVEMKFLGEERIYRQFIPKYKKFFFF